jgi:K+-transporting ATPase ATPase C chain
MFTDIKTALRPAIALTLLFTLLLGLAYPLALTGIGQALFPRQANGSLIRDANGRVIGSELLAQGFASPRYFAGRPSAAGQGYDAAASAGSNLGPNAQALADRVKESAASLRTSSQASPGQSVPADLVTTSASGLDPHLSPEAALYQAPRVAAARGVPVERVRALVREHVEGPGLLGQPRVNVLALNRALDGAAARR